MRTKETFSAYTDKPFLIAGHCALESEKLTRAVASGLKDLARNLQLHVVFKGSYSKANRTRLNSYRRLPRSRTAYHDRPPERGRR